MLREQLKLVQESIAENFIVSTVVASDEEIGQITGVEPARVGELRVEIKKKQSQPEQLSYGERKLQSYRKIVARDYEAQLREKDAQLQEKDRQIQEIDRQIQETDRQIQEIRAKKLLLFVSDMSNEEISDMARVPLTIVEELRAEIEENQKTS